MMVIINKVLSFFRIFFNFISGSAQSARQVQQERTQMEVY